MEDKPTPMNINKIEEEKNEIIMENEEKKDEIENEEENEIKDDEIKEEDIKIDEKELDFIEQPELEIKSEEDLEKIKEDNEKIEINNKLNPEKVLDKLTKTKFTKLEYLSLSNIVLTSLNFLNNESFKTLIMLHSKN